MHHSAKAWVLTSEKIGDSAQARLIADALAIQKPDAKSIAWEIQEIPIAVRERFRIVKPAMRPSLHHIDEASAANLKPPWPSLAIAAGRRMGMALLWIKAQSGGRTKIVYLGRPQRHMERFDLVIAPSQFRVPDAPNLLRLAFPLVRIDEAALTEAAQAWHPHLADLPAPLIVLLVGGPQRVLHFDAALACDLLAQTSALAREHGGSLYVSTSRRTPQSIVDAMAAVLPPTAKLHRWSPEPEENPYLGLLAHGDAFVVTGDSISMLVEVAGLGRPLAIYHQPPTKSLWRRGLQLLSQLADQEDGQPALRKIGHALYRFGLVSYPRDLSHLHDRLIGGGYAVPFGETFPEGGKRLPVELPRVTARISALFRDDVGSS